MNNGADNGRHEHRYFNASETSRIASNMPSSPRTHSNPSASTMAIFQTGKLSANASLNGGLQSHHVHMWFNRHRNYLNLRCL